MTPSFGTTNGKMGLGVISLTNSNRGVRLIKMYPLIATEIEPGIRRCLLARFPYSVIYGIDHETIVVIAIAHLHRQPRYWADRLDSL
jgi:hypothetical protein